jgi:hypothetical protein
MKPAAMADTASRRIHSGRRPAGWVYGLAMPAGTGDLGLHIDSPMRSSAVRAPLRPWRRSRTRCETSFTRRQLRGFSAEESWPFKLLCDLQPERACRRMRGARTHVGLPYRYGAAERSDYLLLLVPLTVLTVPV